MKALFADAALLPELQTVRTDAGFIERRIDRYDQFLRGKNRVCFVYSTEFTSRKRYSIWKSRIKLSDLTNSAPLSANNIYSTFR